MTATAERRGSDAAVVGSRPRGRLRPKWTTGHVVPIVLAVSAGLFVLVGLRDRSATVSVPVASEPIPAGAMVTAANTHLVKVHRSESRLLAGLMPTADVGSGWFTTWPVSAGSPITMGEVSRGQTGVTDLGNMSIPVALDRADGGSIQVGDRVDVISVQSGTASYVAQGLSVLAVASSQTSGLLAGPNSDYWLTVAVDRATALRLAAALGSIASGGGANGLEVVRSTGEPAPASPGSAGQAPPTEASGG